MDVWKLRVFKSSEPEFNQWRQMICHDYVEGVKQGRLVHWGTEEEKLPNGDAI